MKLPKINKQWALFLDRDGVINHRIIGDYVKKWEEFEFMPQVPEAIAKFTELFGRIFIVTNQQGIGKGLMTKEDLEKVHNKMKSEIEKAGGKVDAIYFCPKLHKDKPFCRKPEPGMAHQAMKDFPEITMNKSIMVGDSISDIVFGNNLGMISILVTTNEEALESLRKNNLANSVKVDLQVSGLSELSKILAP